MDGNDVAESLIDFDAVAPSTNVGEGNRPAFLPGVDPAGFADNVNNNPFDLVALQSECRADDPFESVLMNAMAFRPLPAPKVSISDAFPPLADEDSFLDVSKLSVFDESCCGSPFGDLRLEKGFSPSPRPVAASSKLDLAAEKRESFLSPEPRHISPKPELEPGDLELMMNVKGRVERCIRDALNRSKGVPRGKPPLRDDAENRDPNVRVGSAFLQREKPADTISDRPVDKRTDTSVADIRETLRRIRLSNAGTGSVGDESPSSTVSCLSRNTGFLRSDTASLGSAESSAGVWNEGFLKTPSEGGARSKGSAGSQNSRESLASHLGADLLKIPHGPTSTPNVARGRSNSVGALRWPSTQSDGDDSVFEEAKALASAFRERANSFVADNSNADDADASFCDLRTSRRQWETSALTLPPLEMEDADEGRRGAAPSPRAPEEKSLLRSAFDEIMSMKRGEPGNRSLRRSLSSGVIEARPTSETATSTPAPLSRDKVRDLSLQSRHIATPDPMPPPLQTTLRPRRDAPQSAPRRGPMRAVVPVGDMVRKHASPPKAAQKSPPKAAQKSPPAKPPRKSRSPSGPATTPVAGRRASSLHAPTKPQFTSTPQSKLPPSRRADMSPGVSPVRLGTPVRSRSLAMSGQPRGYNEAPTRQPSATPDRNATGHLKSLPSPPVAPANNVAPSNIVVNHGQTPRDLSVQTWNRGPAVHVTSAAPRCYAPGSYAPGRGAATPGHDARSRSCEPHKTAKLASLKGTIYDKAQPKRSPPPKTPTPKKNPPLRASCAGSVSVLQPSTPLRASRAGNVPVLKPSTPLRASCVGNMPVLQPSTPLRASRAGNVPVLKPSTPLRASCVGNVPVLKPSTPLGASRAGNVPVLKPSTPLGASRAGNVPVLKPSTPKVLRDANVKVSRLPVSASPARPFRLESLVARKFQQNTSVRCEKENVRPVY